MGRERSIAVEARPGKRARDVPAAPSAAEMRRAAAAKSAAMESTDVNPTAAMESTTTAVKSATAAAGVKSTTATATMKAATAATTVKATTATAAVKATTATAAVKATTAAAGVTAAASAVGRAATRQRGAVRRNVEQDGQRESSYAQLDYGRSELRHGTPSAATQHTGTGVTAGHNACDEKVFQFRRRPRTNSAAGST
jgi:hypothetical protein